MARPQTDLEAGREQLLDIATAMIEERGNAALTMTELAALAGMSPANLYRYFENKEAVIEAIAGRWFAPKVAIMRKWSPASCRRAARCTNSMPAASP